MHLKLLTEDTSILIKFSKPNFGDRFSLSFIFAVHLKEFSLSFRRLLIFEDFAEFYFRGWVELTEFFEEENKKGRK